MGSFSYVSKNKNKPLYNPWSEKTLCELQLLVSGEVIERIRGIYNGYGSVETDEDFQHYLLLPDKTWKNITEETKQLIPEHTFSGDIWNSLSWNKIVDLDFSEDNTNGIAVWHLNTLDDKTSLADSRSEHDPDQGNIFDEEDEEDY